MDVKVAKLRSGGPRVISLSTTPDYILDVTETDKTGCTVTRLKRSNDSRDREILPGNVICWESIDNQKLGACAAIDSKEGVVFACLEDRRRVVLLTEQKLSDVNSSELKFDSPLFNFVVLSGMCEDERTDIFVAVGECGETSAYCLNSTGRVKCKTLPSVPLEKVLAVSCFENDHVILTGVREQNIVVYPMRFIDANTFDALDCEIMPPLHVPQPPALGVGTDKANATPILGLVLNESSCFALYANGNLHMYLPPSGRRYVRARSLQSWYRTIDGKRTSGSVVLHEPDVAVQLYARTVAAEVGNGLARNHSVSKDMGGIAQLGQGYIAVGYGQYVSVWDHVYKVGHALVDVQDQVSTVCTGLQSAGVVVGCTGGMYEVRIGEIERKIPASLAMVLRRKGTCDSIVQSMQSSAEAFRIKSQPVTVSATGLAAESAKGTARNFRRLLSSHDDDENKLIRALLNRHATASPESVARLTEKYTVMYRKVRRGNYGNKSELGLSPLPSERLAAVAVARCLYEVYFGNGKYVVPLIDMVSTGVVSSEAVLAVLAVSDSWGMSDEKRFPQFTSIIDPLLTRSDFFNALEAIVLRVNDLPEADLVRILQFAVRFNYVETKGVEDVSMGRGKEIATTKSISLSLRRSQAFRLIERCLASPLNRADALEALRQVPLAGAMIFLETFDDLLGVAAPLSALAERSRLPLAPPSVRRGFFNDSSFSEKDVFLYRGVGMWLEKDQIRQERKSGRRELQGCIQWTSLVIDAHLQTLMMDEGGIELTRRLLHTVRDRRKEVQLLQNLQGLTTHLVGQRPIPNTSDPLYTKQIVRVPACVTLDQV